MCLNITYKYSDSRVSDFGSNHKVQAEKNCFLFQNSLKSHGINKKLLSMFFAVLLYLKTDSSLPTFDSTEQLDKRTRTSRMTT